MNTLKTLAVVATATLVMAQRDPDGAGVTGGADGDFAKKEAVVEALKTCFREQTASTLAAAKTACKRDADVTTAFTAWGSDKAAAKETEIDILLTNNPNLRDAIETDFAVDVVSATDADIEGLIGVAAGATAADKAAGVKDYRQKDGADKFADAVKTCKETGTKTTEQKKACATGSAVIADLCTKTKNTLECCNGNGASNCDAKDALKVLEGAADEKMSKATTACSNVESTTPAAIATCMTAAAADYTEITGVDLTGEAGLTKRKEKLEKAAKGAVGDAVGACMADLDTDATASDRMSCVGGPEAKKAMADALGKAAGDITKTDAAKFAKEGAQTAGLDKMKTFTGSLADKLTAAKTDMAAAAGKIIGTLFIFLYCNFFVGDLVIMFLQKILKKYRCLRHDYCWCRHTP